MRKIIESRRVLLESEGIFYVDTSKYERELKDEVEDLRDWSIRRHGESNINVEEEFRWRFAKTMKNMHKLGRGLSRIASRLDADVSLSIEPQYANDRIFEPVKHAYVKVHKGNKPARNSPGFTYFGPREVEDVLDAGDRDFFMDQDVEMAYFQIVNEIRNPGSSKKTGKMVRVYTSRPVKDRKIYTNAKNVPSGIFVTNDPDRAEGFGRDWGGKGGRDLWRIVVDSKNLIQTLKSGRYRDYQIVGRGKVSVKSTERLN